MLKTNVIKRILCLKPTTAKPIQMQCIFSIYILSDFHYSLWTETKESRFFFQTDWEIKIVLACLLRGQDFCHDELLKQNVLNLKTS